MYYECCVCKSSRQDAILHHFPCAEKRLNKWLECLNRDDLIKLPPLKLSKLFVCQKHFEKKFITSKSHLIGKAYPSLFTEDEILSGIPSRENAETKDPAVEHSYVKKVHNDHNYYSTQLAQKSRSQKEIGPTSDAADVTNVLLDTNTIPENVISKCKLPGSDDANDDGNDVGMYSSDEELYDVEYVSMFDEDGDVKEHANNDIIISGDPTAETNLLIVGNDIPENVVRVSKRKLPDSDDATDAESRDANDEGNDVGLQSDEELYEVEYLSMFDDDVDATVQANHDIIISDPKYSNMPSCEEEADEPAGQEGEVHEGTACSVCKGAVRGFRYTCIECVYELCRVCEALGAHAHHHVLRVPSPRPYGEVESVVELVRQALRCREHSQMDFEEVRCDVTDTMSVKSMRTECDPFSDVRSERSASAFPDSDTDTDSQVDFEETFRRPPAPPPPRPAPAVSATRDTHVTRTRSAQDYNMKTSPAILTTPATQPGHAFTHGSSQTGQYTQHIVDSETDQPSCTRVNMNMSNCVDGRGQPCSTLFLVLPPKLAKDTVRRQQVLEMITTELRNQDALQRLHKLNENQLIDAERAENRRVETSFKVIAR